MRASEKSLWHVKLKSVYYKVLRWAFLSSPSNCGRAELLRTQIVKWKWRQLTFVTLVYIWWYLGYPWFFDQLFDEVYDNFFDKFFWLSFQWILFLKNFLDESFNEFFSDLFCAKFFITNFLTFLKNFLINFLTIFFGWIFDELFDELHVVLCTNLIVHRRTYLKWLCLQVFAAFHICFAYPQLFAPFFATVCKD